MTLSDTQFASVVADHPELRLEPSAQGEPIMSSGRTGRRNLTEANQGLRI